MFRYALTYGGLAGLIIITTVVVGMRMGGENSSGSGSEMVGYLVMLVALSLVFVGVKRYRDQRHQGYIGFWAALGMGTAIAGIAALVYVSVWETYLAATDYAFVSQYTDGIIADSEADGMVGMELEDLKFEMEKMEANYAKPVYRLFITFLEIFPLGLIVAIISAALLRRVRPQTLYQD